MTNWFSTYHADDWTPEKGYNEVFQEIIWNMRRAFQLKKAKQGIEAGTGYWMPYTFQEETVFVTVDAFVWNQYSVLSHHYITPVFTISFRMSTEPDGNCVFLTHQFLMEFPENYPVNPPHLQINDSRYKKQGGGHDHHLYSDGWICLYQEGDWNPKRDTVITALNWAFDWLYWHYSKYGW